MSSGGNLILINNTNCDWNQTYHHSYQMNIWNFPQTIAAGTSQQVRVSYDEITGKTWTDDGGDVIYQFSDGSGSSFHIRANHPGKAAGQGNISVTFTGISTSKYPAGTPVNLGFAQNGQTILFLACENGTYYIGDIATPYTTW